jgi:hypothetical protein
MPPEWDDDDKDFARVFPLPKLTCLCPFGELPAVAHAPQISLVVLAVMSASLAVWPIIDSGQRI